MLRRAACPRRSKTTCPAGAYPPAGYTGRSPDFRGAHHGYGGRRADKAAGEVLPAVVYQSEQAEVRQLAALALPDGKDIEMRVCQIGKPPFGKPRVCRAVKNNSVYRYGGWSARTAAVAVAVCSFPQRLTGTPRFRVVRREDLSHGPSTRSHHCYGWLISRPLSLRAALFRSMAQRFSAFKVPRPRNPA